MKTLYFSALSRFFVNTSQYMNTKTVASLGCLVVGVSLFWSYSFGSPLRLQGRYVKSAFIVPSRTLSPSSPFVNRNVATLPSCEFTSSPLMEAWERERERAFDPIAESLKFQLKDKQVLFVAGLLNEYRNLGSKAGEKTQVELLTQLFDMPVSTVGFPSNRCVLENSQALKDLLQDIYQETNKPFVLIGHSKGGAESLCMVLRYPELLLQGVVDQVIILQAPLNGCSVLTDNKDNAYFSTIRWLLRDGVECLMRDNIQKMFGQLFQDLKDKISSHYARRYETDPESLMERISRSVWYVRTTQEFHQLEGRLQFLLKLFDTKKVAHRYSDGILLDHEQKLGFFGNDLGVSEADHLFFFRTESMSDHRNIYAFLKAVLSIVYNLNEESNHTS